MKKMNPFQVEEQRQKLAKAGRLKELKKTYASTYPEIQNKNTPAQWDRMNLEGNHFTKSDDLQAKDKLRIVSKNIKGNRLRVLNIGFGSGNLERLVYGKNKSIAVWEGVDISKKSIAHAKKHFPDYHFKEGSIDSLDYKSDSFDYVIFLEVLEHISPKKTFKALSEVKRVLKPGGTVIISIPLNEDLERMINEHVNFNEHVRVYTPELIRAELSVAGFEVFKEEKLISFKKYYLLKKLITRYILPGFRAYNGITVYARKPV